MERPGISASHLRRGIQEALKLERSEPQRAACLMTGAAELVAAIDPKSDESFLARQFLRKWAEQLRQAEWRRGVLAVFGVLDGHAHGGTLHGIHKCQCAELSGSRVGAGDRAGGASD
jgi:hypothetical protein